MNFRVGGQFINKDGSRATIVKVDSDSITIYWGPTDTTVVPYTFLKDAYYKGLRTGDLTYDETLLRRELVKDLINE